MKAGTSRNDVMVMEGGRQGFLALHHLLRPLRCFINFFSEGMVMAVVYLYCRSIISVVNHFGRNFDLIPAGRINSLTTHKCK